MPGRLAAAVTCAKCMVYIDIMREVDLRRADLNLLVVLNGLLEERSVTRAARRLGMSQPAVSRALGRLRGLFADALLVDGPDGYLPTVRAEAMQPDLQRLLAGLGDLLDGRAFDPATATGSVRLVMLDLEAAVLGPRLIGRLTAEAPGVDLEVIAPGPQPLAALETDRADAVIGVVDAAPAGIHRRTLYEDRFVTLMRAGHPAAGGSLSLERYLGLDHVVVSITGSGRAWVDAVLARTGRERRVAVRVPSFFAAAEIVAGSYLVMTLPSSLARTAVAAGRFVAAEPPLDPGRIVMSLAWHARHQDAPRHVWLRRTIVAAVADLGL